MLNSSKVVFISTHVGVRHTQSCYGNNLNEEICFTMLPV